MNQVTYMMCVQHGNEFKEIIGPFFYGEKDKIKALCFPNKPTVLIEETVFMTKFPERYKNHLYYNWYDKMYCYFTTNAYWIGNVQVSIETRSVKGSWFGLFEIMDEDGDSYFELRTSIVANQFYVAKLKQDLIEIDCMELTIGQDFYMSNNKVFNDNAISRYLAEKCCTESCLS
jgi:hypothetical protein